MILTSFFSNIVSFVMVLLMSQNIDAKNVKPITGNSCEERNVELKKEFKSKYKYFFFRRTNRKKTKRIEKIVDGTGNVILQITMKSTDNGDQYEFRKFHRLVITGKEIHEVVFTIGKENGKLIIYNFCGKKVNELTMKSEELLEKYGF